MTEAQNSENTSESEAYSPGVQIIWHHNHRIAEFDMRDFTLNREMIDAFIKRVKDFAVNNCPDNLVLTLYNFSTHKLPPFSSYFRLRSQDATHQVPERFYGRSAVLLRPSPLTQLYRLVIRAMNIAKKSDYRVERQVFLDRDAAMAWLVELAEEFDNRKESSET